MNWKKLSLRRSLATAAVVVGLLAIGGLFSASAPELTEVYILKRQNIELQMQYLQQQFAGLQGQVFALDAEILEERGLDPSEWRVNWVEKRVERIPQPESEPKPEE